MELSKFKHLQQYMTILEIDYGKFECIPQRHQLPTLFNSKIEEVFENIETKDEDMSKFHSMIKPIFNRNFGNTFHHHNGPNQRQHINKTLVNSIKPYTIKDQGPYQLYT